MDQRVKLRRSWFDSAQLWVVVAGSGVAVVAAVAKLLGANWPWAATAGLVVAGAAALLSQGIGPIRGRRRERAEAERRVRDVLHRLPAPIDEVDPYSMGVFQSDAAAAARYPDGADVRPPYVERTIDGVLRPAIDALAKSGGLVVVRGDPKSGKSRTLWEALVSQVGSRVVYGLIPPLAQPRGVARGSGR